MLLRSMPQGDNLDPDFTVAENLLVFGRYFGIADDVIRELVAAEPPGRPVVVVTSDREVATDVVRAGFRADRCRD